MSMGVQLADTVCSWDCKAAVCPDLHRGRALCTVNACVPGLCAPSRVPLFSSRVSRHTCTWVRTEAQLPPMRG